jgi:hypothetical protein
MIFKSKIGRSFLLFFLVFFVIIFLIVAISHEWLLLLVTLPVLILAVPMFVRTSYTITFDQKLLINCGLFFNKSIDINLIRKIKPITSALNSPALSFDRLEIFYNKFDEIMISPKEKEVFIETMKSINPAIET